MNTFRMMIKLVIYYSGFVIILRSIYFKLLDPGVRILYMHRVMDKANYRYSFFRLLGQLNIQEFEKRLKYLRRFYKIISIEEFYSCFKMNKTNKRSLVLTFDDGYQCFYKNVFPLLKKFNIPATVFLTTGLIDNNKEIFWYDKLIFMIAETKEKIFFNPDLMEGQFLISSDKDKIRFYAKVNCLLKSVDNEVKNSMLEVISKNLNVDFSKINIENQMLTWQQMREMSQSGLVVFGSHTVTHPVLTRLPLELANDEINESKLKIEQELLRDIKFFCYPNGTKEDFNEYIKGMLKEAGYSLAFTTCEDVGIHDECYEIPRCGINREPFCNFALKMSGVKELADYLRTKVYSKISND